MCASRESEVTCEGFVSESHTKPPPEAGYPDAATGSRPNKVEESTLFSPCEEISTLRKFTGQLGCCFSFPCCSLGALHQGTALSKAVLRCTQRGRRARRGNLCLHSRCGLEEAFFGLSRRVRHWEALRKGGTLTKLLGNPRPTPRPPPELAPDASADSENKIGLSGGRLTSDDKG